MQSISPDVLSAICEFDTCTIANAIENFGVRLRNEGYTRPGLRCFGRGFPRAIGYAATCQVRSGDPPMSGGAYLESTDWWQEIQKVPSPRMAIVEDLSDGMGSVVGEVHANILKALQCTAVVTNGAVRDLEAVNALGFPLFARAVSISHSYAHMVRYSIPVEISGLRINPGDLLFGDCHGVINIPFHIAADVAAVAREIRAKEQRIIAVCQSPDFSTDKLRREIGSKP